MVVETPLTTASHEPHHNDERDPDPVQPSSASQLNIMARFLIAILLSQMRHLRTENSQLLRDNNILKEKLNESWIYEME